VAGVRLSIEYGTANTVAVLEWPDGRRQPLVVPSGVGVDADGRLLAGDEAVREARLDPDRFLPYPLRRLDDPEVRLGGRTWPVVELVAATLAQVRRAVGGAVTHLVLVHPVGWPPARVELLARAATAAGLPAPVPVPAPAAAAAALPGPPLPVGRAVIVYHLGAGSFEASVVRREASHWRPLAHRALDVGGIELDDVFVELVAAEQRERSKRPGTALERRAAYGFGGEVRAAREALSGAARVGVAVPGVRDDIHLVEHA
jgi:molecular chaperone DnaK (HSP70)